VIAQQEENNLSDLASSCEYLTSEKLCLAVSESEKAGLSRQVDSKIARRCSVAIFACSY
jgi:hypothetical protein